MADSIRATLRVISQRRERTCFSCVSAARTKAFFGSIKPVEFCCQFLDLEYGAVGTMSTRHLYPKLQSNHSGNEFAAYGTDLSAFIGTTDEQAGNAADIAPTNLAVGAVTAANTAFSGNSTLATDPDGVSPNTASGMVSLDTGSGWNSVSDGQCCKSCRRPFRGVWSSKWLRRHCDLHRLCPANQTPSPSAGTGHIPPTCQTSPTEPLLI